MKHIPGPWWVECTCVYGGQDFCGKPYLVADVNGLSNVDDNARLIAAAPELLEALVAMREAFTSDGIDGQHAACVMADATISKLKGEH